MINIIIAEAYKDKIAENFLEEIASSVLHHQEISPDVSSFNCY